MGTPSLTWGFSFTTPDDPSTDYAIEALAAGTAFGNPDPLVEVVKSLLVDGSLAVLQGWDNRTVGIRVRISAPRGAATGPTLAAAEAALMAQVLGTPKSPLIYTPASGSAEPAVFDVVAAKLERDDEDGWDILENRSVRHYFLTLTCLPFARTLLPVTVPAIALPPASPTIVSIDDGTSATGWLAINGSGGALTLGSVTSSGGSVQVTATRSSVSIARPYPFTLRRTGSVTVGSSLYLRVEVGVFDGTGTLIVDPNIVAFSIGGGTVEPVATERTGIGFRYYLPRTTTTFTQLDVVASPTFPNSDRVRTLKVHDVSRTDTIPNSGTGREVARSVAVPGSAPTQATIRLYDATPAALGGDVLVYTANALPFSPALRQYRTSSSTVTSDSTLVSGARNTLATSMVFNIPAPPADGGGEFALMARVSVSTATTITWSAKIVGSGGGTTLGSTVVVSGTVSLPVTSGYQIIRLGRLTLPVVATEGSQVTALTLSAASGGANVTVDEAFLFGLDIGVLTWVQESTVTWIEIRSPELGAARPSVYGGLAAVGVGGTCIDWAVESFGTHRFTPGTMQMLVVASSSTAAQSELVLYPRSHTHPEAS